MDLPILAWQQHARHPGHSSTHPREHVIGGSSAVGRSILLAIGKVKPFTISVLLAGLTNVIASWLLVRYVRLGLVGIVLGTVIAVIARCAIWMPWYVDARALPVIQLERPPMTGSISPTDGGLLRLDQCFADSI